VILQEYRLVPCRDCGTWNIDPRPSAAAQTALHDSDAYHEHAYLAHRRANVDALDRRCAAIFERIGVFLDLASLRGERVLDIGCDVGQFVASAARQFGIVPVGLDVAHLAVERARDAGVDAYHCTVEDAPASLRGFPVIMAIDVIEHVADPDRFCRAIADRLRPGGVAYLETPNVDSTVYRFGRAMCGASGGLLADTWHRLFPQEHIQYFRPDGLRRVAERAGLRVLMQASRVLPPDEIAVGQITRTALGALQLLDHVSGEKILRWAILGLKSPRSAEASPGARTS
jgi:2-polyprenyl-3-methyl-5-hydroxy-6-metoxy-1,4-benzoquinol methylase